MIQEIQRQTDIVNVISQYLPLSQKGNAYVGLCPFHEDHSPSMMVNPERQFFKCFACGEGGNAFQFVMKYDKVDFPHAVEKVAHMIQYPLKLQPQIESPNKPLYQALDQFFNYCHLELFTKDGQKALDYLHSRNFSDEIIHTFKIGYAPAAQTISHFYEVRDTDPILLQKSGLIYERKGYHPFFHSRITIPIHDAKGNPIGITARVLPEDDGPKYVNSAQSDLYQKSHTIFNYHRALPNAKKTNRLILVEGAMDVLGLEKADIHEGIACLGTALTRQQLDLIEKAGVPVIVLYDEDEAGRKAAYTFGTMAQQRKIPFSIARLEKGKDPDECFALCGQEGLQKALETTVSFLEFCFEYLKEKYNLNNYEDKRAYALELHKLVLQLPDYEQSQFFKRIEQETGFSFEQKPAAQKGPAKTIPRKKRDKRFQKPLSGISEFSAFPKPSESAAAREHTAAVDDREWERGILSVFKRLLFSTRTVEYIDRATRF